MNGWGFSILWQAGRAMLEGRSPYSVPFFYYPPPIGYILAIPALLPEQVSFWLWIAVNLVALVAAFRKQFWPWLFYLPVLHMLSSGNIDLIWWTMERGMGRHWRGALLGAVITLKPQAAALLLPWHLLDWVRHDRPALVRWAVLTALLWAAPLVWHPSWLGEWLQATPQLDFHTAGNTPGLFSLLKVVPESALPVAVLAAALFAWGTFQGKEIARASATLASPIGMFYQTMALLGCAPARLLVPTSLVAGGLSIATSTFIPFMLIPLAVLVWHLRGPGSTPRSTAVSAGSEANSHRPRQSR